MRCIIALIAELFKNLIQAVLARPTSQMGAAVLVGSCGLPSLFAKAGTECAALPMGKRPGYFHLYFIFLKLM